MEYIEKIYKQINILMYWLGGQVRKAAWVEASHKAFLFIVSRNPMHELISIDDESTDINKLTNPRITALPRLTFEALPQALKPNLSCVQSRIMPHHIEQNRSRG